MAFGGSGGKWPAFESIPEFAAVSRNILYDHHREF